MGSMHHSWGALTADLKGCSTVCGLAEQSPAVTAERRARNLGDHLVDLKGEQTAHSRDKHSAGLWACSMHHSWGALMVDMKAC